MTVVEPVFVKVSVSVCCAPTTTLPNAPLEGLLDRCPFALPFPVSGTFTVESDALLASVSVSLKVPAALGANCRLRFVLAPAATVTGKLGAVTEK